MTDLNNRVELFKHVNAKKSALYRCIMDSFAAAKRQYSLRLRPDEVLAQGQWSNQTPRIEEKVVMPAGIFAGRDHLIAIIRVRPVAGGEEGFVRGSGNHDAGDAVYDVQRRVLAAVGGPSTRSPEEAPVTLEERLSALVAQHIPDSDEGRHTALRHQF